MLLRNLFSLSESALPTKSYPFVLLFDWWWHTDDALEHYISENKRLHLLYNFAGFTMANGHHRAIKQGMKRQLIRVRNATKFESKHFLHCV